MSETTRVRDRLAGGNGGIHSVEVAAEILLQLASFRQPTSLKSMSEACKLSPSKVHRYLTSLAKQGLVFHGQKSASYSLGRNAILIGLAGMQQIDQIDEVFEELPLLVKTINCHVALSVWSKSGPTIIKWERSNDSVVVPLQLGQVLPILHSASGRVYAAFLDDAVTRELIEKEKLSYGDSAKQTDEELQSMLSEVHRKRFAISKGEVESETIAISTPVVDWQDNPIVVVTAIVSKHAGDDRVLSILTALRKFSEQISVRKPSFPYEG